MTPFPESEIMIIKRLEVALKKNDYDLLKSGSYKLHEKYHSGHIFEYSDILKEIMIEVTDNVSIPSEIKDILLPTINDILSTQTQFHQTAGHVSTLTSLSYNTQEQSTQNPISQNQTQQEIQPTIVQEEASVVAQSNNLEQNTTEQNEQTISNQIQDTTQTSAPLKAFEVFSAPKAVLKNTPEHTFTQSPFSAQPFKEFTSIQHQPIQPQIQQRNEVINLSESVIQNDNEIKEEIKKQTKSVAIFYGQDLSNEKIKNILKYRKMLFESSNEKVDITELLDLISEINTQSNTNVMELKNLLDQLKTKENKVNLITNSQSSHLINLLKISDISYSIFNPSEEKRINLLPILGLTNLFKCSECEQEYLDLNEEITPYVLQCSKCKKPMYPVFYTTCEEKSQINLDYYNSSIITLANSKVWLLIHPLLNEKVTTNMLRSALKVSSEVEEIFILDKDINVREQFRKTFLDINPNIKINTNLTILEDFFNLIN